MQDRIPLEDFFRKPERVLVTLSPDGAYLAYMAPHERRLNLHVRDLATGAERRLTDSVQRDISGYLWAGDDQLVFAQDTGGDENFRLFGVGLDGEPARELTPYEDVKCGLVDDLEDCEGEILFQMNRRDPQCFDVYRLDVRTGEMHEVAQNPGNIQSWITDFEGKLRMAVTTDGVNTSILARDTEADDWRTVATYNFMEAVAPLQFTFDGKDAIVSSNLGRDKSAIYQFDLATGKPTELLFEHEDADVSSVLSSRKRRKITGVAFEFEKPERVFFDDEREAFQKWIDDELPNRINSPVSHTRDEMRYVVHSANDQTRGAYYLADLNEKTLTHLFDLSPWLDANQMAEMKPISYTARDGLTVHGYLTLPKGVEAKWLPLVVNPHGGPWARDSWRFISEVQMLANRGAAVLQMNFRGSTGFGRSFMEKSFCQWGLTMQDDITDGVRWAVDQGIVDPKRVAIYGASYGGYATLSGLTKTPELYCCGVDYVGVSNLFTWIEAIPPYWKPYLEMMYQMVGHPERDEDRFRATSPFFQADKIRVPLLVAQGANDPRVRKPESDQIVQALRDRDVPVDYIVKDNEGHGFHNEENQMEFYRRMEAFLEEHLFETQPVA